MKTTPEYFISELDRLYELKGSNLETYAPTFATLAKPALESLVTCRNHWKASFEQERETVKRLRRALYTAHNSDDPAVKPCQCYDCNLMRSIKTCLLEP